MTEVLRDLFKVNSRQIYLLWRNFASSLCVVMAMVVLMRIMPTYFAPIISTLAAGALYFMVYSSAYSDTNTCVVVPYTFFLITVTFTFLLIILNLLNIWGIIVIPSGMVFFDGYFIPGLLLGPTGLLIAAIVYIRRHRLSICSECRLQNGAPIERGKVGIIFSEESELQIKNIMLIFTFVSIICWGYFFYDFNDSGITSRDSFVFTWVCMVIYGADLIYFGIRYYNLYLDLKERDEVVSPDELQNISTRTYLRYYVICEDNIYLMRKQSDELREEFGEVYETPFFSRRVVNGVPEHEVRQQIEKMTGVSGGVLKFFFGRKVSDVGQHKILRYFYFLPGEISEYPQLAQKGEWLSSEKFKTIYNTTPLKMSSTLLSDISRLATILITAKTFHENGERRNKLMQYRPSFNFRELANVQINFQDDLWIRVSIYNADKRFFRLKRLLRRDESKKKEEIPYNHTPLE